MSRAGPRPGDIYSPVMRFIPSAKLRPKTGRLQSLIDRRSIKRVRFAQMDATKPPPQKDFPPRLSPQAARLEGERCTSKFPPIVVRDACRCEQCVDPSDRQRNFSYSDIPRTIGFDRVSYDDDAKEVQISWSNDIPSQSQAHRSVFSKDVISRLNRKFRNPHWDLYQRPVKLWGRDTYTQATSRVDFNDYMTNKQSFAEAMHLLWRDGLLFIDGVPESEGSVSQIVNRIGPLQQTFYGPTWDVRSVPNAKNVAYTSKYLGFHMDLLYMRDPPGFQFLHCVHNSATGGESRFADTFRALDQIFQQHPMYYEMLRDNLVRYEYDNDGFFYSDAKPTVQSNDALNVPSRPVLNSKSTEISNVAHCFWSPPFVGHIPSRLAPDELVKFIGASKLLSQHLEMPENVVEEKMDSGTCVIFDNLRIVHARNAFDKNSGKRWLRGAYLNRQDFVSKAASVMADMPPEVKLGRESSIE
ncbi:uncharacterized protein PV06_01403 [Exophiala oligosperma]|uniref:TauD/TfdA-like domain-containing protein n=1 Tax=Exophiala oligosperma TaxID=215243 RepID=A0A0D2CFZ9_9EURO|nr:uncharacterized protein PV06_01403 [Exophiala oligosperma]KIW48842.1 hypothetical protein PV06_01403 [Exophiala oligosperma]